RYIVEDGARAVLFYRVTDLISPILSAVSLSGNAAGLPVRLVPLNVNTPSVGTVQISTNGIGSSAPASAVAVAPSKDNLGNLQYLVADAVGNISVNVAASSLTSPLLVDPSLGGTSPVRPFKNINGADRSLQAPAGQHIVANGTVTITAADAWIASVVITTDVAGTGSTVTIQDKAATPKKLVNGLATTALSTLPNIVALTEPVFMS